MSRRKGKIWVYDEDLIWQDEIDILLDKPMVNYLDFSKFGKFYRVEFVGEVLDWIEQNGLPSIAPNVFWFNNTDQQILFKLRFAELLI